MSKSSIYSSYGGMDDCVTNIFSLIFLPLFSYSAKVSSTYSPKITSVEFPISEKSSSGNNMGYSIIVLIIVRYLCTVTDESIRSYLIRFFIQQCIPA